MGRLSELDFLKCVMIILMISFHLVYIGDSYPYAKQVVYTFHMPVFLIISGFLMNIEKPAAKFCKTIAAFLVPYIIMEGGYIVMASFPYLQVSANKQGNEVCLAGYCVCAILKGWHRGANNANVFLCWGYSTSKQFCIHGCFQTYVAIAAFPYCADSRPPKSGCTTHWWGIDSVFCHQPLAGYLSIYKRETAVRNSLYWTQYFAVVSFLTNIHNFMQTDIAISGI